MDVRQGIGGLSDRRDEHQSTARVAGQLEGNLGDHHRRCRIRPAAVDRPSAAGQFAPTQHIEPSGRGNTLRQNNIPIRERPGQGRRVLVDPVLVTLHQVQQRRHTSVLVGDQRVDRSPADHPGQILLDGRCPDHADAVARAHHDRLGRPAALEHAGDGAGRAPHDSPVEGAIGQQRTLGRGRSTPPVGQAGVTGQRVFRIHCDHGSGQRRQHGDRTGGRLDRTGALGRPPPQQGGQRDHWRVSRGQMQLPSRHRPQPRPVHGRSGIETRRVAGHPRADSGLDPVGNIRPAVEQGTPREFGGEHGPHRRAIEQVGKLCRDGRMHPVVDGGRRGPYAAQRLLRRSPDGAHFVDEGADFVDRRSHQPAQRRSRIRLDQLTWIDCRDRLDLQLAGGEQRRPVDDGSTDEVAASCRRSGNTRTAGGHCLPDVADQRPRWYRQPTPHQAG